MGNQVSRQAIELITGGFRPTNAITESWIGKVYLYKQDEVIPKDNRGDSMIPLFQLSLENLPFVPQALSETKILTVFVSEDLPMDLTPNGQNWVLREYKDSGSLTIKDLVNNRFGLKPFPLRPQIIEEDYPIGNAVVIPDGTADGVLALERSGEIDGDDDGSENHYGHKIGGYPSFCQSEVEFGDDFEFLIQIASDEKARLNIIDRGTIFLAKNSKTGEWKYYCDFF